MLHARTSFATTLLMLFIPSAAFGTAPSSGGDIKCDCTSGSAKCVINGKDVPVDCGASTPTKQGKLPAMQACVGSSFPCMKGVECIEIEGAIKFHKTNCGKGGSEGTGNIKTAGCIEMGDQAFNDLKSLVGASFDIKGPGGGKSGR